MKNYVVLSDEHVDYNWHLLRVDVQPGLFITSRSSPPPKDPTRLMLLFSPLYT